MKYASDYRAMARQSMQGNLGTMILISIVYSLVVGMLSSTGFGAILAGVFAVGSAGCYIRLSRNAPPRIENLFDSFTNGSWGRAIIMSLVMGIFVFLWSLLFLIPGIIMSFAYAMAPYIMAENPNIDSLEAIRVSKEMMRGNKWRLFCLTFSFFGWILLSMFTFGILLIYVVPYMETSIAHFYNDVKASYDARITGQNTGAYNYN